MRWANLPGERERPIARNAAAGVATALLGNAAALLLDFDGPICDTFRGCPPLEVTARLAVTVRENGCSVPDDAIRRGPHDFLAWVGDTHPGLTELVERQLSRAEEVAVTTAPPTPYAAEVIRSAAAAGLRLGIVSNNAVSAITRYLRLHAITQIRVVCGRPGSRLDRMKPAPWPVFEAARLLGVQAGSCVLVGDTDTDVHAARAAGTPVIGYATSPGREALLSEAGADLVVRDMRDLVLIPAGR